MNILSIQIWLPLLGAILLMIAPLQAQTLARGFATLITGILLFLSCSVYWQIHGSTALYGFEIDLPWLSSPEIHYHLGVNHLGSLLMLLTSLVGLAAVLTARADRYPNHYFALILIILGGLLGAFASLDLFFMYVFHEFALIPTFLLIGIWGSEHRHRAAMKITLYLGMGSLILLFGFLGLYWSTGANTFDLLKIKEHLISNPLNQMAQTWIFGFLFLGFGILVSIFPFHTWAPLGYSEAPAPAAMLHAGVIKKFGLFGLFTIAIPLLPLGFAAWKPFIFWMALGNLVYCGYVAIHQKDLRYLLSYSSISHMGYALLALLATTPLASTGFELFLFAHGLSAAAAFMISGHCKDQAGTAEISGLGGLATQMPFAATAFTMAAFAGCGLPGFASFPAEIMIFFGSFRNYPLLTSLALWTVVLSSIYYLRSIRNVFLGPANTKLSHAQDAGFMTRFAAMLLLGTLLWAGFFPSHFQSAKTGSSHTSTTKPAIRMAKEQHD